MFALQFTQSVPAYVLYVPAPSTIKARTIEGAKVAAVAIACATAVVLVTAAVLVAGFLYCAGTIALSIWLNNCRTLEGDMTIATIIPCKQPKALPAAEFEQYPEAIGPAIAAIGKPIKRNKAARASIAAEVAGPRYQIKVEPSMAWTRAELLGHAHGLGIAASGTKAQIVKAIQEA